MDNKSAKKFFMYNYAILLLNIELTVTTSDTIANVRPFKS